MVRMRVVGGFWRTMMGLLRVFMLLLLFAFRCGAQGVPTAQVLLDRGRELIDAGKAEEARTELEQLVKDFPKAPQAETAKSLIDRIKSIEVFVDYSHEANMPSAGLTQILRGAGLGITRNHAYIPSQKPKLAEYELVVLWQQVTDIRYDDLEYATLLEYVREGGRLLMITNSGAWMGLNRTDSVKGYPLPYLARRFGLKLDKEFEELAIGKGKVFHYRDTNLLSSARLESKDPEVRRAGVAFFEKLLPYPQLENSPRNDDIEAELSFKEGRVTFYYPQTLKTQALWAQKVLPTVLGFCRGLFREDLDVDVTVRGIPATGTVFFGGKRFEIALYVAKDTLLHDLSMQLCRAWMRPGGLDVHYPHWLESAWVEMVTVDLLRKLGAADRFAASERYRQNEFRNVDPNMNLIDISIAPKPGDLAFTGKCEFIFRDLVSKYGDSMLSKFRNTVRLYSEAGQLPALTTAETIRLLSLAVGKDLFPYFRSLGTGVEPLPVDLDEPARLRKLVAEKKPDASGK